MDTPFDRFGPDQPATPVVLSVPHAGREYPSALRGVARVTPAVLAALEDRYVDAVACAALGNGSAIVARMARAWIDLNRGEDERDPRIDDGAGTGGPASAKVRSGLGLVPRRVPGAGEIWRRRLGADEVTARIAAVHRPYHAAVADALAAARRRFGVAVLLDLHSMPSLGAGQPLVVIGDRYGRAASARLVQRVEVEIAAARIPWSLNAPYAGGHVLARHARPDEGVHAIQLELDRSLYLDARLDRPGVGLSETAALLRRIIDALADEALSGSQAIAAE